jgi:5-methylcytosine-specific restriction endonuclease McrA
MLLQRFGEVPCFICCAHVDLSQISLEHITPLSRGGTDDFANLAISHRVCNLKRGNRLLLIK